MIDLNPALNNAEFQPGITEHEHRKLRALAKQIHKASGWLSLGKHRNVPNVVNEGIWSDPSNVEKDQFARKFQFGHTSDPNDPNSAFVAGESTEDYPTFIVDGMTFRMEDSLDVDSLALSVPAPSNECYVHQTETGVITTYASHLEALLAWCPNGNFANGTDTWSENEATNLTVTAQEDQITINGADSNDYVYYHRIDSVGVEGWMVEADVTMPLVPGAEARVQIGDSDDDSFFATIPADGQRHVVRAFSKAGHNGNFSIRPHTAVNEDIIVHSVRLLPPNTEITLDHSVYWGVEIFPRVVDENDPWFYAGGWIQSAPETIKGIATEHTFKAEGYTAQYKGQTDQTRTRALDMTKLSTVELNSIVNDPSMHVYRATEDGALIQWCARIKVTRSYINGNRWLANNAIATRRAMDSGRSGYALGFQGNTDTPVEEVQWAGESVFVTHGHEWEKNLLQGVYTLEHPINAGTDNSATGEAYYLFGGVVPQLNVGGYNPFSNPSGTSPYWSSEDIIGKYINLSYLDQGGLIQAFTFKENGLGVGHVGFPALTAEGASYANSDAQVSGRTDDRYADILYSDGLNGMIDYRIPLKGTDQGTYAQRRWMDVISGKYRGVERLRESIVLISYANEPIKAPDGFSKGSVLTIGTIESDANERTNLDAVDVRVGEQFCMLINARPISLKVESLTLGDEGEVTAVRAIIIDVSPSLNLLDLTKTTVSGYALKSGCAVLVTDLHAGALALSGNYERVDTFCGPDVLGWANFTRMGWRGGYVKGTPDGSTQYFEATRPFTGHRIDGVRKFDAMGDLDDVSFTTVATQNGKDVTYGEGEVGFWSYQTKASMFRARIPHDPDAGANHSRIVVADHGVGGIGKVLSSNMVENGYGGLLGASLFGRPMQQHGLRSVDDYVHTHDGNVSVSVNPMNGEVGAWSDGMADHIRTQPLMEGLGAHMAYAYKALPVLTKTDLGALTYQVIAKELRNTIEGLVVPPPEQAVSEFGRAIHRDEEHLYVGDPRAQRVHLYRIENDEAVYESTLAPPDGVEVSGFGGSITSTESQLIVGAYRSTIDDTSAAGIVLVFTKVDGGWAYDHMLKSPNVRLNEFFGNAVSAHGEYLAVGNLATVAEGTVEQVYIYKWTGADYVWHQTIATEFVDEERGFGNAVEFDQDRLIIGAPKDLSENVTYSGRLHVYQLGATDFEPKVILNAPSLGEVFDGRHTNVGHALSASKGRLAVACGTGSVGKVVIMEWSDSTYVSIDSIVLNFTDVSTQGFGAALSLYETTSLYTTDAAYDHVYSTSLRLNPVNGALAHIGWGDDGRMDGAGDSLQTDGNGQRVTNMVAELAIPICWG